MLIRDCFLVTCSMQRLRLGLGMRRRFEHNHIPAHNELMHNALRQQLSNGHAYAYGRRHLYTSLKRAGIPVARDRMYEQLRLLDPAGIASRPFALQRTPRGTYHVPGPDVVLSVDGHHKMSEYGIEVYAGIDGYSR